MNKETSTELSRRPQDVSVSPFEKKMQEIEGVVTPASNLLYRTGEAAIMASVPGSIAYQLIKCYSEGGERHLFYKFVVGAEAAITAGGTLLGWMCSNNLEGTASMMLGVRALAYGAISKMNREHDKRLSRDADYYETQRIRRAIKLERGKND